MRWDQIPLLSVGLLEGSTALPDKAGRWTPETETRLGYHLGAQCPPSALEIWGRTVMGRQRWAVQGPADRCCSAFPICGLSVCIYTGAPAPTSRQTLKHCDQEVPATGWTVEASVEVVVPEMKQQKY